MHDHHRQDGPGRQGPRRYSSISPSWFLPCWTACLAWRCETLCALPSLHPAISWSSRSWQSRQESFCKGRQAAAVWLPRLRRCACAVQDQRLNYVEQHAERIGVDAGRLESARVSAAKGSIMGDTLDVCARHADAPGLEALVPALGQLLKRGVGLNTQAGAARFISSLAMRLGSELRPQSGALLKVEPPLPW